MLPGFPSGRQTIGINLFAFRFSFEQCDFNNSFNSLLQSEVWIKYIHILVLNSYLSLNILYYYASSIYTIKAGAIDGMTVNNSLPTTVPVNKM